jgi:hypothetical protein
LPIRLLFPIVSCFAADLWVNKLLNLKLKLMKTMLFIFLISVGLSLAACSQQLSAKETPALVQNTLKARYPDVTAVEWEKKKNLFEAEFFQGEQELSVLIDPAGHIKMTKQDISSAELPAGVAEALRKDYPDFEVDDAEKREQDGQVYYQVELEKGFREHQLVLGSDGRQAVNVSYWD